MGWFTRRKAEAPTVPGVPFVFLVEDLFIITGRGQVFTGKVGSGTIAVGESVNVNVSGHNFPAVVSGLEKFAEKATTSSAGEVVGVLLKGLDPEAVPRVTLGSDNYIDASAIKNIQITQA